MTELENQEILHQIYLEKYKTGEANKIIKLLDDANKQIIKELKKTNEVYTKKRYEEIKKLLTNISKELKENINNSTDLDGIIDYEIRKQKKLLGKAVDSLNIELTFPSLQQVKTSALFAPVVEGMTYQSYLDNIQAGLFNQWDTAVRTGYLTNETTQKIVSNIMGTVDNPGNIQTLRNSIYRNTRTVLQSFASETRNAVYKKNDKYFEGYQFFATLDRRTCVICAKLDGKVFKTLQDAPDLPIHYNCRCVLIPKIKGVEEIAPVRPMKGGTTKGSVKYPEWLAMQTEKVQREILGKSRYELYKKGEPITAFTEGTEILTLKELNGNL